MTKQLKCVNQKELSKFIDNLGFGESIDFSPSDNPNTKMWFFAQKVYIPHYNSKFVLFDMVDGGYARVQPVSDFTKALDIEIILMDFIKNINWDYEEGQDVPFFGKNKYGLFEAYIKEQEDN